MIFPAGQAFNITYDEHYEPVVEISGNLIPISGIIEGPLLVGEEEFKNICIEEFGEEVFLIIQQIRKLNEIQPNTVKG